MFVRLSFFNIFTFFIVKYGPNITKIIINTIIHQAIA